MPVKLKEIKGLILKDKEIGNGCCDCGNYDADSLLDKQGEVQIGLNREKLAAILWKIKGGDKVFIEHEKVEVMAECYYEADFIISAEADLLERKE